MPGRNRRPASVPHRGGVAQPLNARSGHAVERPHTTSFAHSRERGNPEIEAIRLRHWIPASAGMSGRERIAFPPSCPTCLDFHLAPLVARVERSETRGPTRRGCLEGDGFRCAQPILRLRDKGRKNLRVRWCPPCAAHSRASGNPEIEAMKIAALGPRFRGDEREGAHDPTVAPTHDRVAPPYVVTVALVE